jgi:hypothetical protein
MQVKEESLMHLEGILKRKKSNMQVRHIAEILNAV